VPDVQAWAPVAEAGAGGALRVALPTGNSSAAAGGLFFCGLRATNGAGESTEAWAPVPAVADVTPPSAAGALVQVGRGLGFAAPGGLSAELVSLSNGTAAAGEGGGNGTNAAPPPTPQPPGAALITLPFFGQGFLDEQGVAGYEVAAATSPRATLLPDLAPWAPTNFTAVPSENKPTSCSATRSPLATDWAMARESLICTPITFTSGRTALM
jgi:hypothetical protein